MRGQNEWRTKNKQILSKMEMNKHEFEQEKSALNISFVSEIESLRNNLDQIKDKHELEIANLSQDCDIKLQASKEEVSKKNREVTEVNLKLKNQIEAHETEIKHLKQDYQNKLDAQKQIYQDDFESLKKSHQTEVEAINIRLIESEKSAKNLNEIYENDTNSLEAQLTDSKSIVEKLQIKVKKLQASVNLLTTEKQETYQKMQDEHKMMMKSYEDRIE